VSGRDRERVLGLLRELELADEEAGAALAELDELAREAESVRVKALDLAAFEARLPGKREAAGAELTRARGEREAARAALAEAEAAVRTARPDGEADARRFEIRARDRVSVAERRARSAEEACEALERRAEDSKREGEELGSRAAAVAEALQGRPRVAVEAGAAPTPGLAGVANWGEAARAALFVARGQVAAERDALVRQANEVGGLALGEPLTTLGASAIVRRVEAELG
jgi:chromosome segregation protein